MTEDSPLPPRMGPAVVTYVATLLAALYVWGAYRPQGLALGLTIAAPVAALAWLARQGYRRRRMGSCDNLAQRTYNRRAIPLMIAYVAALAVAIWLRDRIAPTGLLAVALAILPALPLVGMVWALGRLLVEEQDEYLRSLHVRQFMIATGFMLVVTCVWGFLETFGLVPHVPMYWAFIIWCAGLGIGTLDALMKESPQGAARPSATGARAISRQGSRCRGRASTRSRPANTIRRCHSLSESPLCSSSRSKPFSPVIDPARNSKCLSFSRRCSFRSR